MPPEPKPPVHIALSRVMADVGAVGKGQRNTQQGYAFRGIDDVMNAVHQALVKHEVLIVPIVSDVEYSERTSAKGQVWTVCRMRVRYDIWGPAGDVINAIMLSEGMDNADKATSKAESMALKYCLLQLLMIPTKDMQDGDKTTPQIAHAQEKKRTADELRLAVNDVAQARGTTPEELTERWREKNDVSWEKWFTLEAPQIEQYVNTVVAWHERNPA